MLSKSSMLIPLRYGVQFGVVELVEDSVHWTGRDRIADVPCHLWPLGIMSTVALECVAAHAFVLPARCVDQRRIGGHLGLKARRWQPASSKSSKILTLTTAGAVSMTYSSPHTRMHLVAAGAAASSSASVLSLLSDAVSTTPTHRLCAGWGGACGRFLQTCVVTATSYELAQRFIVARSSECKSDDDGE